MRSSPKVYYFSVLCADGKTYRIIKIVIYSGKRTLIVLPTTDLADEVGQEFIKNGLMAGEIKVIHSVDHDNPSDSTAQEINKDNGARVIIITFECLKQMLRKNPLKSLKGIKAMTLIVDETPQAVDHKNIKLDRFVYDRMYKSGAIELKQYKQTKLYEIVPDKNHICFEDIAEGNTSNDFNEWAKLLLNDMYKTYVYKHKFDEYENIINQDPNYRKSIIITTISVLNKKIFTAWDKVVMSSALFEETELYHVLKHQGVDFIENQFIGKNETHKFSDLITLHKLMPGDLINSAKFRNQADADGVTNIEKFIYSLPSIIGEKQFIHNANKKDRKIYDRVREDLKKQNKNQNFNYRLVKSYKGSNVYMNYTDAVWTTSLNMPGVVVNMLKEYGFDDPHKIFGHSRNKLDAYQFFMRTFVRRFRDIHDRSGLDATNTRLNFYMMDQSTIDFLLCVFPDATVISHNIPGLVISATATLSRKPKTINDFPMLKKQVRKNKSYINKYKGRPGFETKVKVRELEIDQIQQEVAQKIQNLEVA